MAWHDADSWLTRSFGPYPTAILLAAFIAFFLPVCLHLYIYRKKAPTSLPTFLLIGPSGAGKTSLLTLVRSPALLPPLKPIPAAVAPR